MGNGVTEVKRNTPKVETARTNGKKIKEQSKPSRWDSIGASFSQFCNEVTSLPATGVKALIRNHVDTDKLQKFVENPKAALKANFTGRTKAKANANGVTKVNRRLTNQALIDRFIRESVRC